MNTRTYASVTEVSCRTLWLDPHILKYVSMKELQSPSLDCVSYTNSPYTYFIYFISMVLPTPKDIHAYMLLPVGCFVCLLY